MTRIIDLKNIHKEDIARLYAFFNASLMHAWFPNQTYQFEDGEKFKFADTIIRRHRKEGSGVRYEVFDSEEQIAEGCLAKIFSIKGTVRFDSNTTFFKAQTNSQKSRVVKKQFLYSELAKDLVFNEYEIARDAGHLHIKEPTTDHKKNIYTVMQRLPGRELIEIINEDAIDPLSTIERLTLSIELLKALKHQVIDKGIIHRDIKPDNILVSLQPLQVNIIDYGFAHRGLEEPLTEFYGVESFRDQFSGDTDSSRDLYAMARVIALVWRVDIKTYNEPDLAYSLNQKLTGLFKGINDLPLESKDLIKEILKNMLLDNLEQRMTIDEAIAAFEQVERQLEKPEETTNFLRIV